MIFAVGSRRFKTISGLIVSHKKKHEAREFPSWDLQQFSGFSPILLIFVSWSQYGCHSVLSSWKYQKTGSKQEVPCLSLAGGVRRNLIRSLFLSCQGGNSFPQVPNRFIFIFHWPKLSQSLRWWWLLQTYRGSFLGPGGGTHLTLVHCCSMKRKAQVLWEYTEGDWPGPLECRVGPYYLGCYT